MFSTPNLVPRKRPEFLDTVEGCAELTAAIMQEVEERHPSVTSIGIDCEGVNLGREGELCILTVATRDRVYLVDTFVLDGAAFAADAGGLSKVLENERVLKYFFDCRQDADALHSHYGVKLNNVVDLQYTACKLFPGGKQEYLMGLKKTMEKMSCTTAEEARAKELGGKYFSPEKGGSYDNWKKRPLDKLLVDYSVVDVKYFFLLADRGRVHEAKARMVGDMRVKRAEAPDFQRATHGKTDWDHLFVSRNVGSGYSPHMMTSTMPTAAYHPQMPPTVRVGVQPVGGPTTTNAASPHHPVPPAIVPVGTVAPIGF